VGCDETADVDGVPVYVAGHGGALGIRDVEAVVP
jgi:hypothetical protein